MRVRPTEGSAPVTTSTMAASRSPGRPRPAAATARGAGAAGTSSGAQTSQHGTSACGCARSPKWRRIAARRHSAPSTKAHTARYWRQRARWASPADDRHVARARPSKAPSDAPAQPIDRRRRRAHDARPREMADDGAHALGLRIAGGRHRQVVAAVDRGAQQRAGHRLERRVVDLGALDEEDVQTLVAALREEQRARREPVAPRAPGLLVVGLDRPRHRGVRDGAHVGLVDAHAERVGGHHDLDLAVHEAPLGVGALLAPEAGVVGQHLGPQRALQRAGQVLGLGARARVDDGRARPVVRERAGDPRALVGRAAARHHGEGQVRAIEAGGDPHRVAQPQARDDVRRDLRRRRGGRGHERLRAQPARRVGQAEVVRAEVVAPLRDAVRLVDDEQPDVRGLAAPRRSPATRSARARCRAGAPRRRRPARSDGAVGPGVLLGVDHGGAPRGDALEPLDLVLHQGHERRDHHREVVAHQRRQLVAQRLARARGHDDEHVARRAGTRQRPHGLGLAGAEGLEAEERSQCGVGGVHGGRPTIAAAPAGTGHGAAGLRNADAKAVRRAR